MMKCSVFLIFSLSCLQFLTCGGIILNHQEQPKPAYSSGIKTKGWKSQNNILTHQNYSKVYAHNNQNNPSQYIITKEEKLERVYPIYNAHSYGQPPANRSQNILATSSLTGQNRTNNGQSSTVVGTNQAGTHNNRTIYKRKISYKTIEVYEKCPEGATGSFVYYASCNQFLNCWKGRGEVQNCAPGTLFNPKSLECDFPEKVDCVTGRQNSLLLEQSIRSQKSVVQATCPKDFSGLIPNYTDCSKFINCNNGQQVSMDCPPGTLFDTTQNICNFPHLTTCFNGQSHDSQTSPPGDSQTRVPEGMVIKNGRLYGCRIDTMECSGPYDDDRQHSSKINQQSQHRRGFSDGQLQQYGYNTGQQSIDSKLDFGIGSATHGQTSSNQGHTFYIQHGTSSCNPQTQNCGSNTGTSSHTYYRPTNAQNCNPQTQNCGQSTGNDNQQIYGYNSAPACDPRTQGCGNNQGQSYGQFGAAQGQTGLPSCDPRYQNCGQGQVNIHQQTHGHSGVPNCDPQTQNCGQSYGYGTIQSQTVPGCDPRSQNCRQGQVNSHQQTYGQSGVQNCDPQTRNCGQSHGYAITGVYGYHSTSAQRTVPQTHGSGQQNFHRVCNINDSNCRLNKTTTTKKNTESKCPDGFQGITKHPSDCKKFLNCANGRTFVQDCAPGTLFNPTIGNCDFPYNVDCASNETDETATEYHNSNSGSDWQTQYNQHAREYGNNAGHGNIRTETSSLRPQYHPSRSPNQGHYDQGHEQWTTSQDQDRFFHNQGSSNQYRPPYNQGHVDGSTTQGQVSYNQGSANQDRPTYTQGHVQGSSTQGQNRFSYNQDSSNQGRPSYNQGNTNQNQGSSKQGVKTNQGAFVPWHTRTNQGNEITVLQPLTPRPIYVPSGTVINRGQIGLVNRPGPNPLDVSNKNSQDYADVFDPNQGKSFALHSTTPRSASRWPPPFPSTDVNADYVFEYDDGEPVTLEPENVFEADKKKKKKADCGKGDFYCSGDMCISKTAVCDGNRDCANGSDELDCQVYLKRFAMSKNSQLNILEEQRWNNVSEATCALLCIRTTSFECRSFNYRKIDRTCFLSKLNLGLTGALRQYYPFDYYELKTSSIDCTLMFKCNDNKCISSNQLCDGFADCEGREDEKNCEAEDFGYSIRLAGTKKANEGRVEVTAFGKTGYICDDHFGIQDANVICRELGFQLGAAEVKGQSYYATDVSERNTMYMIDDLDCLGNETTVLNCNFPGWGIHNCRNQEIAGLVCKTPQETCGKGTWKCDTGNECIPYSFVCDGLFDCTDDSDEGVQHCEAPTEIRLANGTTNAEGRVEIKHHDIWGTICDDDFNEDAAKVVCKYLGFSGSSTVKKEGYFGPGDGPIWLDQVSCYGNETELRACTHWDWGEHNCDHSEDVGVVCSNEVEDPPLPRHSKISEEYSSDTGLPANTCGFRKDNQFLENDLVHVRVVEGGVARKGDYPWQAALRIKGKAQQSHHWCGAVILSSQWVITAAHCLLGYSKGAYMIVAGDYNTDENENTEQTKYIEEFFIHDNFTEGGRVMKNDIALIKVKGVGFFLNNDVQPICLPDEDADYEKELNCTISGFGSVKSGNSAYSHNMMAAWIPIIRSGICKMPHVYDTTMSEGMICAGFLSGGVDSCHGDSGGPLACLQNGLFTLYGITSWGHRCGFANKPGVYVKVAYYKKWIDDTIKNNS